MISYLLSLVCGLYGGGATQEVAQVENHSVRIVGSFRDNTTKDFLKKSTIRAVFKSGKQLTYETNANGVYEIVVPDSTQFLTFDSEGYRTHTIPVTFIGKISSKATFSIQPEMVLTKDSLQVSESPSQLLYVSFLFPDGMDVNHVVTKNNSKAFTSLDYRKTYNKGKHFTWDATELSKGIYEYKSTTPEGKKLYYKQFEVKEGYNFMEVTPQPEESLSPPAVALTDQVLYFSQSTYELSEEVKTNLDAISKALVAQPQTKLQITGHTDNVGESDKNLILSEYRAKVVASYLEQKGVSASQLVVEWKGAAAPAVSNDLEENKIKNRRVELKVIP